MYNDKLDYEDIIQGVVHDLSNTGKKKDKKNGLVVGHPAEKSLNTQYTDVSLSTSNGRSDSWPKYTDPVHNRNL